MSWFAPSSATMRGKPGLPRPRLAETDLIALPLPVLCELVWVLAQGYKTVQGATARVLS